MVKARVELQFYPTGSAYEYHDSDKDAEPGQLAAVLAICDKAGAALKMLLPESGRGWWKDGLELDVADKKVSTAEIVKKVMEKLEASAITHGKLEAMRATLPPGLVLLSGGPFPPAADPNADKEDVAMNFGVAAQPSGGRTYYIPTEGGPVICCGAMNFTFNESPLVIRDAKGTSGRLDVRLIAHFDPAS
jgi:hypothetical protein